MLLIMLFTGKENRFNNKVWQGIINSVITLLSD